MTKAVFVTSYNNQTITTERILSGCKVQMQGDCEDCHNMVHCAPYCGNESTVITTGQCVENFKSRLAVEAESAR